MYILHTNAHEVSMDLWYKLILLATYEAIIEIFNLIVVHDLPLQNGTRQKVLRSTIVKHAFCIL